MVDEQPAADDAVVPPGWVRNDLDRFTMITGTVLMAVLTATAVAAMTVGGFAYLASGEAEHLYTMLLGIVLTAMSVTVVTRALRDIRRGFYLSVNRADPDDPQPVVKIPVTAFMRRTYAWTAVMAASLVAVLTAQGIHGVIDDNLWTGIPSLMGAVLWAGLLGRGTVRNGAECRRGYILASAPAPADTE